MTTTDLPLEQSTAAQIVFPMGLALIAGVVDVTTFVLLGGLFTAHITGNLVVLLADLALRRPLDAAGVLSIPLFIAVSGVVAVVADRRRTDAWVLVRRLLVAQLLLVLAAGVLAVVTDARAETVAGLLVSAFAVAGMAVQNTLLHLAFRKVPTTAVMTGNIVAATVALAGLVVHRTDAADAAAWRAAWPLVLGFTAGVIAGAIAAGTLANWAWSLPIVLCAAIAAGSFAWAKPPEIK